MIDQLDISITDADVLRNGYIVRNGYIFALGEKPAVYDTLVIRVPSDAVGPSSRFGFSQRTLSEHIELINKHKLKKAKIICDDLSFILNCPSLCHIAVYPAHNAGDGFDYSPLYRMPNLRHLCCITTYGAKNQYHCTVDYSRIKGAIEIAVAGDGHIGYELVPTLEKLWISNSRNIKDLSNISCSIHLNDLTLMQCSINSLSGIEKHNTMRSLALYHNRSLIDISALTDLSDTLKVLVIESCPKISDFSVLSKLKKLEHLQLYGPNTLPNLDFLQEMINLKTFTFTMNVENGDLSLCMNLPYVSCKNRKHYNLKDSQLPKSQ